MRTFRTISDVVAEIDPEQAPAIRRLPFVNYLEPDESLHPAAHYTYLAPAARLHLAAQDTSWGLKKIGAHSVWTTYGYRGEYASITMIDTGVDSTHLSNLGLDGPEMLTNCLYASPTATSCYQHMNHGAAVAGVMSARDNINGYIGIANFPFRFSSINVCSPSDCPWSAMTAALDWAVSSGYARHVVNISMQACNGNSTFASSLAQAANAGILVVSIAGNTSFNCSSGSGAGTSGVTYPGKYVQAVAVSGTMEDDSFATGTSPCFAGSRWGPEVVLSAPFWHPSMTTSGGWATWCGTSFSAPTVAAAAAVLWSANTSWTAAQVLDRLTLTAIDLGPSGHDNQFGWGRVALYDAFSTVPPPPPPPPLNVQIHGPTSVKPGVTCTWTATANGAPPLSYDWRLNGSPVGWYDATFEHTSGSNNFDLGVVITDSAEGSGSESVHITVSWEAPDCLDM